MECGEEVAFPDLSIAGLMATLDQSVLAFTAFFPGITSVPVHLWIAGAQPGQDSAGFGFLGIVFHHQPLVSGFNEMKVRLVDTLQAGQDILQSAIFPETDTAVHSDKVTFAVHIFYRSYSSYIGGVFQYQHPTRALHLAACV